MENEVFIGKLSVRTIGCKPEGAPPENPKRLCVILGKANSLITGVDKAKDMFWTAIGGSFMGINLETGEKFRSGKLFLPSGIQETIEASVKSMAEEVGENGVATGTISFAFEIRSVAAKNPAGYSYQAVQLIENKKEDELASIFTGSPRLMEMLAAPVVAQIEAGTETVQTVQPTAQTASKRR